MRGCDTSSLFGVRGDPVEIGEDEFDSDEGGVSGVPEATQEAEDEDVVAVVGGDSD